MSKLLLFLISIVLLFSCEKTASINNNESSGQTGTATLEITPAEAARNSTLSLTAKGLNLSEAKISWLVNDAVVDNSSQSQFQATQVVRGDTVQAKAELKDQSILSNIVTIGNSPPEVTSVKLLPEVFKLDDRLRVEAVGTDPDGDTVTFLYQWTKNGASAGSGNELEGTLQKGDKISVKITPFDEQDYGKPVTIEKEVRNMPPVVIGHKDSSFDGSVYTYQVKASDPDGDALTYSIESPPDAMTIDSSTGLLRWVVPQEFKGTKNVSVIVSDGNGGTARYGLRITIH